MLLVLANGVDVTGYVGKNSIRITEQMNNRANTLAFQLDQYSLGEGSQIQVYTGFSLAEGVSSGNDGVKADNLFEYWGKRNTGDEVILDINGPLQQRMIIDNIDYVNNIVYFTSSIVGSLDFGTKCGKLEFSGVTMKNPDEEIGHTGTFSSKVNCTDWTKIFDAENVVEAFEDMYSREIFGRIVYEYCANDTQSNVDLFESAWTNTGTARTMVADNVDRIQGTNSMKTGVTGSGTALWTKTISSIDLTGKQHFRIRSKIGVDQGTKITSMKIRVGSDSSNYFEGTSRFIGMGDEDCWNYEAFSFDRAVVFGSPDISDITRLQIEIIATASISAGLIHFDHFRATSGGFTVNKAIRGDRKFVDIRVQHKKPTVVFEEICKLQNFFWFIDYERDLNFFKSNATPAPFSITDDSMNYGDLSITTDISQLKNRQTVRGGEAVDDSIYIQDEITDGVKESRTLDYPPKTLKIFVDVTGTGLSFVEKTVGIENLDDATLFDYVFNFNEKIVRLAAGTIPPAGAIFRRQYFPYKSIRVRVKNDVSIARMKLLLGGTGIYDGAVITDPSIRDWNEARMRAKAEIDAYSNPIISATFMTELEGLKAGQIITITDTTRGIIAQEFLIQKLNKSSKENEIRKYTVDCASTMFGIIEFFQMLLRRSERLLIDVSEIVDVVQNIDEVITIGDVWKRRKKSNIFYVHGRNLPYEYDLTFTEGGTPNDAYVGYSEVSS